MSDDIRVDVLRDASVYWRARGKMTHLPTGRTVEFVESWNDKSDRARARSELQSFIDEQAKEK